MPTLFTVNTQLTQLQSVNVRHCVPLLTAITAGFQRRFSDFLTLAPEVNMAILATMTYPYSTLRWLPHTLFDQLSRLQSLFVSTVKHHAMIYGASSDASKLLPRMMTQMTTILDSQNPLMALLVLLTVICHRLLIALPSLSWKHLIFWKNPEKTLMLFVVILQLSSSLFALMLFCIRLPLWNGYSASQALSHVHIWENVREIVAFERTLKVLTAVVV